MSKYTMLLVISLSIYGCTTAATNVTKDAIDSNVSADSYCPVYDSRNWHAWIDRVAGENSNPRLNVSGQVELPNPGYEYKVVRGPLDRRNPPSLRIRVILSPPDGMTAQVIDTKDVTFQMNTDVLEYRSIIVLCGDRQLGEMIDVVPTD